MSMTSQKQIILISSIVMIGIFFASISFAQQNLAEDGTIITVDQISAATKVTKMVVFVGDGCPHCADLEEYLDSIQPNYPELEIVYYEVFYNETNSALMKKMAKAYGVSARGVPLYFIDKKSMSGFAESTASDIESRINVCKEKQCIDPMTKLNEQPSSYEGVNIAIGIFAVIIVVIGLIILLRHIVVKNKSKKTKAKSGKK